MSCVAMSLLLGLTHCSGRSVALQSDHEYPLKDLFCAGGVRGSGRGAAATAGPHYWPQAQSARHCGSCARAPGPAAGLSHSPPWHLNPVTPSFSLASTPTSHLIAHCICLSVQRGKGVAQRDLGKFCWITCRAECQKPCGTGASRHGMPQGPGLGRNVCHCALWSPARRQAGCTHPSGVFHGSLPSYSEGTCE